jgi:hypothetical protein
MKKNVLLFFIFGNIFPLFGQKGFESFGLVLGGNEYKKTGSDKYGASPQYFVARGLCIGAYSTFEIGKKLSLSTKISYNIKNSKEDFGFTPQRFEQYHFLSLPLQIEFAPFTKKGFVFLTGFEPSYLTQIQQKRKETFIQLTDFSKFNRFDIVYNLGMRYYWKYFNLGFQYNLSLKAVQDDFFAEDAFIEASKHKFQGLEIYIGFPLLKKSDL